MNNDDRTLLIEFYKENQKFIDKGLFTVSSVSLPLLLDFSQKLTYDSGGIAICLIIALSFFVLTITMQLISCFFAVKAYHLLSSHKKKEQESGEKYHKLAGKINPLYMITFILALIFIIITTILKLRTL